MLADAQYNSAKVRAADEEFGAEPVIPVRRDSRVKDALKVGRDFVTRGARRLVEPVQGAVERGEAVWQGEGVAVAGLPQAPGLRAGDHPRGSELHGYAGGGSCGCRVS